MPTRKIISFENGEISPALRFKTNLAAFATGLSKLLNFTVRKTGGVSNRSGFKHVAVVGIQSGLRVPGRVRLFSAEVPKSNDPLDEVPVTLVEPSLAGETVEVFGAGTFGLAANVADRNLTNVRLSQLGSKLIFSNGEVHWAYERDATAPGVIVDRVLEGKLPITIGGTLTFTITTTYSYLSGASVIDKPVMYRVYQVLTTGDEVLFREFSATAGSGVTLVPGEPRQFGDTSCNNLLLIGLTNDRRVKHYNVYRATRGSGAADPGNWGLVGRIPRPKVGGDKEFHDYITQPDFSQPPPSEEYLYGDSGGRTLTSARLIGHYQQRRIIVVNSDSSNLEEGGVVASKAGAVDELDTPEFFTPIGAFDFNVPIGVKTKIVALLEMERLIILTTDAVIMIRGGEQGILTPGTINPRVVNRDGCSERVTPAFAGKYGFFMTKNDEKLMRISFSLEGDILLDEISIISDHLIEKDRVVEMTLTRGIENILWLLKASGKLVSVTIHQSGEVTGWARHDTDGFIESIASTNSNIQISTSTLEDADKYEALMILVVRDGVRLLEVLTKREDSETEKYNFVDSSMSFGKRLHLDEENNQYDNWFPEEIIQDHVGQGELASLTQESKGLTLTGGVNWDENEDITLTSIDGNLFQVPTVDKFVVDFFYDEDGIQKSIRWEQTGFTSATVITGRLSGTLPAALRNATDRIIRTRWLRAKNRITGLTHLADKTVSLFADGVVVSSPLNPYYETALVVSAGGVIELDDYYAFGVVGLPYESEFETLDLDTSDNRTLTEAYKLVNRVGIAFQESKGGYVGQTGEHDTLDDMQEIISREDQDLEEVTANINEHIDTTFPAEWEKTGRVLIKQVDPLPMTVLAVYPKGVAGS